jgi:hypothetical protein
VNAYSALTEKLNAHIPGSFNVFGVHVVSLVPESLADSRDAHGNAPKNSQSSTIVTSTVCWNRVGALAIFGNPPLLLLCWFHGQKSQELATLFAGSIVAAAALEEAIRHSGRSPCKAGGPSESFRNEDRIRERVCCQRSD